MATDYTTLLGLPKANSGDASWHTPLRTNADLIDVAIAGMSTKDCSAAGTITLTDTDGAADESRAMILKLTGTPAAAFTVVVPASTKAYWVWNASGKQVTLQPSGGTGVKIFNGEKVWCFTDGSTMFVATEQRRKLDSQTASASASLDFSFTGADWKRIGLRLRNILPVTDNVILMARVNVGSGFESGAADYKWTNAILLVNPGAASGNQTYSSSNGGATHIQLGSACGNAADEGMTGEVWIDLPGDTAIYHRLKGRVDYRDNGGDARCVEPFGEYVENKTALTGIQILYSSGNIASGAAELFGEAA